VTKANLIQVLIVVGTGVTAFMVASKNQRVRRVGFVVGILCQPLWFMSAYWSKQWGIAITCFWYVFCYARGFHNAKPEQTDHNRVGPG
jgi:ABC-type polysaccharide/polyol phosphate export permease